MSCGSASATLSASRAASIAISAVACPAPAQWRRSMPVRSRIHWSEVSTTCDRSSFVTTRSGAYMPQPTISALRLCSAILVLAKDEADVVTAKAKRVRQRPAYRHLPRLVGHIVQITGGVGIL